MATEHQAHPAKGVLAVRGVTIRDLASRVGCTPHYLSRVLSGHRRPSRDLAKAVADELDEPADELFDLDIDSLKPQGRPWVGQVASR